MDVFFFLLTTITNNNVCANTLRLPDCLGARVSLYNIMLHVQTDVKGGLF